ncbi:MAG: hypothetical protein NDI82_05650 [Anaeromyxobacteraceae bacterium]|nr:hypothetical protein [Anaeromyxobacteraceae bacterium]
MTSLKGDAMRSLESEWELHQPARLRERAAELRAQAERLGRAGYRDQAARHLLEARLHDLKAAASAANHRAA